ncbi:MAG TPA: four-carbon acid sugar kinase family protein [Dongiaceae bacterium]|jgi:uncharacterized protein YgbK (DUF1537 family)|nr:four-carbon acid sugar kinase family protein [Dongiaceae bacterium]
MSAVSLPEGALVSWYGDDFTGAAAVMEVMTFAGLPSVLFFDNPTAQQLAAFAGYRGIGIAGIARSKAPDWMAENLPGRFEALRRIGAPVAHYKVCSTFDSAPEVGSIGKAIDLGAPILGNGWHPLMVAAPAIKRYQAFGNLFAGFDDKTYRLDRHPTMSRHPVTPMAEADIRVHLAHQTAKKIGLVDLLSLRSGQALDALRKLRAAGSEIIAIDTVDEDDLAAAGRLIWDNRGERVFAIGSQGLEYALIAYWREAGLLPDRPAEPNAGPAERIVVVSGSCAPQTAAQIAWASERGFMPIRVYPACALDPHAWESEIARASAVALSAIGEGRDPLIFTAMGPDDPAIAAFHDAVARAQASIADINARIGFGLGKALDDVLRATKLNRGVIAGGDTSGYGAMALGIQALTALAPTVPGAALFQGHMADGKRGIEIALKGGQMGTPDYFEWIKQGGGSAARRSKAA